MSARSGVQLKRLVVLSTSIVRTDVIGITMGIGKITSTLIIQRLTSTAKYHANLLPQHQAQEVGTFSFAPVPGVISN